MSHAAAEPSASSGARLVFRLDGGHTAALAARRAVVAGDGTLPASVRDDVLLLVTELVTNAVRHAGVGSGQSLHVELRWWPGRVRMEVVDPGTSFTRPDERITRDHSGGWGLFLVDRIADRWGVTSSASGTSVWAEIASSQ
jgi:anti-sigma regulatory factor (Ser/Thr protein kinase)